MRFIGISIILVMLSFSVQAQTLQDAKQAMESGDVVLAKTIYEKLANGADPVVRPVAQYELAEILRKGTMLVSERAEALLWESMRHGYIAAANVLKKHTITHKNSGLMSMFDTAPSKPPESFEPIERTKKAEKAFENGMRQLLGINSEDRRVSPNGAHWDLSWSARAGYAPAQFWLAILHRDFQASKADPSQCQQWMQAAAEQGHVGAQQMLQGQGCSS